MEDMDSNIDRFKAIFHLSGKRTMESDAGVSSKDAPSAVSRVETAVREAVARSGCRRLLIGLSGGADSVALTVALHRVGVAIECIHCNFHLRGEESMRDQHFVEKLCEELGIALRIVDFDVERYQREHKVSVEMACRELRYAEFRRIIRTEGYDRIAVAHNSDDNAETLLMNLFRGTGIAGLRAMREDTGDVLRPLLGVYRAEIEAYLQTLGLGYITDSTNLESEYKRNFIRNEVLPLIERRWPNVKRALNLTAEIITEEEGMLTRYEKIHYREENELSFDMLERSGNVKWLLRRFVVGHGGTNDIAEEIYRSYARRESALGKVWKSSGGEFRYSRESICYLAGEAKPAGTKCAEEFEILEHVNSESLLAEIKKDRGNSRLWIPAERMSEIELRTPCEGDRIKPLGMKGSRLVSDVVSDAKLTPIEKRNIRVAADKNSGEVIWVEGLKRSKNHLITPLNKNIIEIVRKIKKD